MTRAVALLGEVDENPAVLGLAEQERILERGLDVLNRRHRDSFLLPLAAPGDLPEFVAVCRGLQTAYPVARFLAEEFHPLPVRVAAARGEVNTAAGEPDQTDGPALDAAGELLYRARKEDRLLLVQGGSPEVDTMANALFLVLHHNMKEWTDRQCQVVRMYREQKRQREVALALGISQQSVSNSLAGAGWKALAEAEAAVQQVLAAEDKDAESRA